MDNKLQAIRDCPLRSSVKELQHFSSQTSIAVFSVLQYNNSTTYLIAPQ